MVGDRKNRTARSATRRLEKYSEQEKQLIARGVLVPARRKKPVRLPKPAGNIPDGVMERIWKEEREDR